MIYVILNLLHNIQKKIVILYINNLILQTITCICNNIQERVARLGESITSLVLS